VHQVLYAGDAVTGQTLGDPAAAAQALHAMATSAGAEHLEARLAGERHLIRSEPLAASGVGFLALKSLDHELQPLHRLLRRVGLAAAVALVLGAAAAYGMAWLVIRRLQQLKQATLRVRSGDFETRVGMRGRDEVALLGQAFNDMVVGLKALGLYTDPALARHILDRSGLLGEQGLRTEGTVFFCDLEGFTSVAESLPAEELIRQLEEYFTLVGRVVAEEGGYLDKFIGDSVMAWWGPPFLEERDHAARALRAAWRCRAGAAELRERWAAEGRPPLRQRIGIATGEVIVGNLGSATKKNFTVIGDRVNVASRLEGANKRYGTEILVDGGTAESAGPGFQLREIDRIQVPGRQEAVQVFELVGVAEGAEARR
jgi:adenylate cyclase